MLVSAPSDLVRIGQEGIDLRAHSGCVVGDVRWRLAARWLAEDIASALVGGLSAAAATAGKSDDHGQQQERHTRGDHAADASSTAPLHATALFQISQSGSAEPDH